LYCIIEPDPLNTEAFPIQIVHDVLVPIFGCNNNKGAWLVVFEFEIVRKFEPVSAIDGEEDWDSVYVPDPVIGEIVPVCVNNPESEESIVRPTEVTVPVPGAAGVDQTGTPPTIVRTWLFVPTVDKPVPPDAVDKGVDKERLVPVAPPIFGVVSVGEVANTVAPVPWVNVVPVPPLAVERGVVKEIDVKAPVDAAPPPRAPGFANVFPFKLLAFRLGTFVVLETTRGDVPVETVDISCPVTDKLVPVAAPIFGVVSVGEVANTLAPVPWVNVVPVPPLAVERGVVKEIDVKAPVDAVPPPMAPGFANVFPFKLLALRLGTFVVLETTKGAVPVATVEVNWPVTDRLGAVAAPVRVVVPLIETFPENVTFPPIVGFVTLVRVKDPFVVMGDTVPVCVNKPESEESIVSPTEVTEPDPEEGLTQAKVVPFEDKYWPLVPTVDRPVPPEDAGRAVPDSVMFTLGLVVGLTTAAERNAGTVAATDVTVPPPPTETVVQESTPEPLVVSTWPLIPVFEGSVRVYEALFGVFMLTLFIVKDVTFKSKSFLTFLLICIWFTQKVWLE
jgi:hypothetical protein